MTSAKTKTFTNGHSTEHEPVDFEAIRRQLEKEAAQLKAEIALHLKDPFVSVGPQKDVLESSFLKTKKSITKSTSTTYFSQEDKEIPTLTSGVSTRTTSTTKRPGILKSSKNGHPENGYRTTNGFDVHDGNSKNRRNSIRYSFDLIPGLQPQDLTVQIVDDKLRVCVIPHEKSSICKDQDCYREVVLPATVDPTSATAILSKEGFLTVDLFTS